MKALPSDVAALLRTFRLELASVLTASNPKLQKTTGARSVILHHLPHRALARAINPRTVATTAPRGYVPALAALADDLSLRTLASAHNGCMHATSGCAEACLAGAGHGGLSVDVTFCRGRRTLASIADPVTYARTVLFALCRELARADRGGVPLAFRLCGTDETPWFRRTFPISAGDAQAARRLFGVTLETGDRLNVLEALSPERGRLHPYEYLKAAVDAPDGLRAWSAQGWDVTASFAADRPTACRDAFAAVGAGYRLAVPLAVPKRAPLPSRLLITYNGETAALPVVDGDNGDARFRDPGAVAVLLREKRARGAHRETVDRFILPNSPLIRLADGTLQLL